MPTTTTPTERITMWLQRLEAREAEAEELGYERQPYVVVIGGGQGGIALGARLRRLDVPTIILERQAKAGDSWRSARPGTAR